MIELSGEYISGTQTFDGVVFKDGVAHVFLADGEAKLIGDIPAGTQYSIYESEPGDYEVTYENEVGTIALNDTSAALVRNTRNTPPIPPVNITLAKNVEGVFENDSEYGFYMSLEGLAENTQYFLSDGSAFTSSAYGTADVRVFLKNGESVTFKLTDIAEIRDGKTLAYIGHLDQARGISVTASSATEESPTILQEKVEKTIDALDLPDGIRLEYEGQNEQIMDAMEDLIKMMLLGILLIYLIMVAQFQSLRSPFIVMFTMPLAFTGGFLALLITGNVFSIVGMIGFIVLLGIVVNNGIVLVDYINQMRQEGMEKTDAIREAGAARIRPVLMTALTTVLGLIPLACGIGDGAEMVQPVAIVCIGGLLYATLMTLVVIPVVYDLFTGKKIHHVKDEELTVLDI